ncbi:hypothetical protein ACFQT4_18585 [Pseudoduganella danionis]|uniref:hypothetical protein n=1 Tax=Pseudoduganella danionis TaxID=1890295 RepID=UPI003609A57E
MTFVQKAPVAGNPIASQDPSYIEQMLKAQRAQQLANALMEQSSQPIQYDQRGPISWTQGLAKMLEAYGSRKAGENADKLTAGAMTAGNKAVASKFFGSTPEAGDTSLPPSTPTVPDAGAGRATPGGPQISSGTDAGAPVPSAPPNQPSPQAIGAVLAKSVEPQPVGTENRLTAEGLLRFGGNNAGASSGGSLVMPGLTPQQSYDAYVTDPTAYMTEFVKRSDNRTDLDKLLLQNGVQPGSQEWTSAHQEAIRKNNYIPPVEVKAGTLSLDPTTRKPIAYNPGSEDGINLDFSNPLRPTAVPVNGYADQLGNIETAKRRAINSQTIAPTDNQPRTDDGRVTNATVDELINPGRPIGGTRQPAVWTGGALSDQQLQQAQQAASAGNRDAQEMLAAYSRSQRGQQPLPRHPLAQLADWHLASNSSPRTTRKRGLRKSSAPPKCQARYRY